MDEELQEQEFKNSFEQTRGLERKKQATKYVSSQNSGPRFAESEFILWLLGAVIADILSLVPYLGAPIGWLFNFLFWLFLATKGLSLKKATIGLGLSELAETLLSTLPACIAYVVAIYGREKAGQVLKKTTGKITGRIKNAFSPKKA